MTQGKNKKPTSGAEWCLQKTSSCGNAMQVHLENNASSDFSDNNAPLKSSLKPTIAAEIDFFLASRCNKFRIRRSSNMIIGFAADIGDTWSETQDAIQCDSRSLM